MKMLNRVNAFLASLGMKIPMGFRISKHAGNKTSRGAGKRSQSKRLNMARGAGSINAKADAFQLARAGRWLEAANMVDEHERRCGESIVSPTVRQVWRSYAVEEAIMS